MRLEPKILKRVPILLFFLLSASLTLLSCGGGTSGSGTQTSGIKYRAFISDSVQPAGVYILNAQDDERGPLAPINAGATPGMMVVTPNKAQTLVFSGNGLQSSDNTFNLINNASEQNAAHVTLPGMTESFVVSPDSSTAYIAVPTAPVNGQSPGVIDVVSLVSGAISG